MRSYKTRVLTLLGAFALGISLLFFISFFLFLDYTDDRNAIPNPVHTLDDLIELTERRGFGPEPRIHGVFSDVDVDNPFAELAPGIHELQPNLTLAVVIDPRDNRRRYIGVDPSAHHEDSGDILSGPYEDIAIIFFLSLFCATLAFGLAVWMSRRMTAPVLYLSKQIDQINPDNLSLPAMQREDELGDISRAIRSLLARTSGFVEREREFTRFASHELRSPITVLQGNLDILAHAADDSSIKDRSLQRMQSATQQMTMLIEGFLWLAREQGEQENRQSTRQMNGTSVGTLIEQISTGFSSTDWRRVHLHNTVEQWQLHELSLKIVLDNIIRNAIRHSEGDIEVDLHPQGIRICNAHKEQSDTGGEGIGLQIVERICSANGWSSSITAEGERFDVAITLHS